MNPIEIMGKKFKQIGNKSIFYNNMEVNESFVKIIGK